MDFDIESDDEYQASWGLQIEPNSRPQNQSNAYDYDISLDLTKLSKAKREPNRSRKPIKSAGSTLTEAQKQMYSGLAGQPTKERGFKKSKCVCFFTLLINST